MLSKGKFVRYAKQETLARHWQSRFKITKNNLRR